MKYLNITVLIFFLSVILSQLSYADDKVDANMALAKKLIRKILPDMAVIDESDPKTLKQGDFNGDGIADIGVVFLPVSEITSGNKIRVQMLWKKPVRSDAVKYHKSIAIFHGSKVGWLIDSTPVFVLLAADGSLEAPAFELLSARAGGEEYEQYYAWRPVALKGDFLIVPTEAGIDTYVYWHKDRYELLWPEEIP